jgi:purine-nucleoside/S-methyl-5'-thioadenosine phosphorylase / adenosine deaminase
MQSISVEDQDKLQSETSMPVSWHGQLPILSYQLFRGYPNVSNIVSTRLGGVSEGPYESLNLALSTADEPQHVLENRRRLCAAVGIELETLTIAQLVQGTRIAVVTKKLRGSGSVDRTAALQETDGLLTNLPNTPLAVLVADCSVVSYFDPVHRVVALAHAGWRGTAGRIAHKMVTTMQREFGSNPQDILVGISPNISDHHFQVRQDVLDIFRAPESYSDQADHYFSQQGDGSYLLDLNAALVAQLKAAGIRQDHIEVSGICTACRLDLFYSHRFEHGKTGRFCGLIVLRTEELSSGSAPESFL